jgi:hypothetical protein
VLLFTYFVAMGFDFVANSLKTIFFSSAHSKAGEKLYMK